MDTFEFTNVKTYDASRKRGAPKTKLLSATPKYNFEMQLKPNV